MRKGIIFVVVIAISLAWGQYPPRELTAESSSEPALVNLQWYTPIIPSEISELAYDDGVGAGIDEADIYDILSVRFTVVEDCSLLAVKFWGWPIAAAEVEINVYPDNGSGKPYIYVPLLPAPIEWELLPTWQEVELTDSVALTFSAGEEFHIGIRKTVSCDPDSYPHYIWLDEESCPEVRSWWYDYSSFGFRSLPGDLLIRALVTTSDSRMARWIPEEKTISTPPFFDTSASTAYYTDLTESVDYYRIHRGTHYDTTSMPFYDMTTDTNYLDSDVSYGSTYYYAVKAHYNDETTSGFSNIAFATPHNPTAETYHDTIKVDDWTFEAAAQWSSDKGFGTLLSPPGMGILRYLQYYFTHTGNFRPEVWSVDASGNPAECEMSAPGELSVTTEGWRNVDMTTWGGGMIYIADAPFIGACICGDSHIGIGVDIPGAGNSFDYNSASWSAFPESTYMIRAIVEYHTDEAYFHIHIGYNMVSVPAIFINDSVETLFPTALGGVIYGYNNETGYSPKRVVEPGEGYWLHSLHDTSYVLSGGIPLETLTIAISPGWNLIGSTAYPYGYSIHDIECEPSGVFVGPPLVVEYDAATSSYVACENLYPGKAYFILAFDYGVIRLLH